jgi:hypothetical protein
MTTIASEGVTEVALLAGDYWPSVGSAYNCLVTSPPLGRVSVGAGEEVDIQVTIECVEMGTMEVLVSASGDEVPLEIGLALYSPRRGYEPRRIYPNDTTTVVVPVGAWVVGPVSPPNCMVVGQSLLGATVTETDVPRLEFAMSCVRHSGTLRLTATMSGAHPMSSLSFGIDGSCSIVDDWGCSPMPDDGVVTVSLTPGRHQVGVIAPGGCMVRPSDWITFDIATDLATDVALAVTCP